MSYRETGKFENRTIPEFPIRNFKLDNPMELAHRIVSFSISDWKFRNRSFSNFPVSRFLLRQ